jgi:hypothetical protein
MSTKQYLTWEQTQYDIQWNNNPYTWDEVFILLEIIEELGGFGGPEVGYQKLDKEKKKKLITLIAKVRGEEFKEEAYKNEDIKVIVKDIEIVAKEVLGIELKITK